MRPCGCADGAAGVVVDATRHAAWHELVADQLGGPVLPTADSLRRLRGLEGSASSTSRRKR